MSGKDKDMSLPEQLQEMIAAVKAMAMYEEQFVESQQIAARILWSAYTKLIDQGFGKREAIKLICHFGPGLV